MTPQTHAATTQTTRLLLPWAVTRTARLRAWARKFDPYEVSIVGTLLVVVLVATVRANLPLLAGAPPAPLPTLQPVIAFRDRIVERQVVVVATPTAAPAAPAEAIVNSAPAEQPAAPAQAEPEPAPAAELQVMNVARPEPTPAAAPAQLQPAAPVAQATRSPYDHLPTAVIAVTPPAPGARVVVDPNMPLRIATATP